MGHRDITPELITTAPGSPVNIHCCNWIMLRSETAWRSPEPGHSRAAAKPAECDLYPGVRHRGVQEQS